MGLQYTCYNKLLNISSTQSSSLQRLLSRRTISKGTWFAMFILGQHHFIKKNIKKPRSVLISGSQIIMQDTRVTPCYSHKKKQHSASINMSPFMACRSVGEPPASCSGFIYQATLWKNISWCVEETRLATLRICRGLFSLVRFIS